MQIIIVDSTIIILCILIAAGVDYQVQSQLIVTFLPGQSFNNMSLQTAELVILNDYVLEDTETFSLSLFSDSGHVMITDGRDVADIIIREDDNDCKLVRQKKYHL